MSVVTIQEANGGVVNITPIQWQGQRIMTLQQVAQVHKMPLNSVQIDFNRHKNQRFVQDVHYFSFVGREARKALLDANTDNLSVLKKSFGHATRWLRIGLTEAGYMRLCKIMTDDMSWDVQEQLIQSYFRLKKIESGTMEKILEMLTLTAANQCRLIENISCMCDTLAKEHSMLLKALNEKLLTKPASEKESKCDDEKSLSDVAEYYGWYSENFIPHKRFVRSVIKHCLGFKVSTGKEYENEHTRCVMQEGEDGVLQGFLYLKQAGAIVLDKWCRNNNMGRILKHPVLYRRNFKGHKKGDVKEYYYIVPGDQTKYKLKDF